MIRRLSALIGIGLLIVLLLLLIWTVHLHRARTLVPHMNEELETASLPYPSTSHERSSV